MCAVLRSDAPFPYAFACHGVGAGLVPAAVRIGAGLQVKTTAACKHERRCIRVTVRVVLEPLGLGALKSVTSVNLGLRVVYLFTSWWRVFGSLLTSR